MGKNKNLFDVALTFSAIVPSGKTLPEAGAQTIAGLSVQLSVAVTVKFTVAPFVLNDFTTRFGEQVMFGGVVSWTVMVCAQVIELLHASVAR